MLILIRTFRLVLSGTGASGRSASSFTSMNKPPPYNISSPSAKLDVNTIVRPPVTHKAKVLYDYDATEDDELSLLADEVGFMQPLGFSPTLLF